MIKTKRIGEGTYEAQVTIPTDGKDVEWKVEIDKVIGEGVGTYWLYTISYGEYGSAEFGYECNFGSAETKKDLLVALEKLQQMGVRKTTFGYVINQ